MENNRLYILTNNNNIVVSFALCVSNDRESHAKWKDKNGRALYIDRLGVNVDHARQGIGGIMIKPAIELAKKRILSI